MAVKSKTLFVLGAGSSNEIGLPLGSELKKTIAKELTFEFDRFRSSHPIKGDPLISDALLQYSKTQSNPREATAALFAAAGKIARAMPQALSIDNYLEAHADDDAAVACGKLAIARSILMAEGKSRFRLEKGLRDGLDHSKVSDVWYGKLFQLLTVGASKRSLEALLDNVAFVTFNYDRSLERYLPFAIDNYYDCGFDSACALVRKVPIFHPYGVCGDLPWQGTESVPYGGSEYYSELLTVAARIQTFSEQVMDQASLNDIKTAISSAETIVFLGFGFHDMNMKLLSVASSNAKRVFATAKGISQSDLSLVEEAIRASLNKKRQAIQIDLRRDLSCGELFDEYRLGLLS